MNDENQRKNRTTVRTNISQQLALSTVRLGLRALEVAAPSAALIAAESLFRRPARHRRPQWERSVLADARALRIAHAGTTVPAWSWGEGPLVLLVHGWEGRGSQLGAFVAPLVRAGYRVVAFDGPGHGDAHGDRSSVIELGQALRSVIDQLGAPHAIIAHSLGCIATSWALERAALPKAPRLVFIAPAGSPTQFTRHFAQLLGLSEPTRAAMAERIEQRYGVRFEEIEMHGTAHRRGEPLLVLHDEEDRDVPVSSGRALVERWKGSRMITTRGLGHRKILRDEAVVEAAAAHIEERPARAIESEEARLVAMMFERDSRHAA